EIKRAEGLAKAAGELLHGREAGLGEGDGEAAAAWAPEQQGEGVVDLLDRGGGGDPAEDGQIREGQELGAGQVERRAVEPGREAKGHVDMGAPDLALKREIAPRDRCFEELDVEIERSRDFRRSEGVAWTRANPEVIEEARGLLGERFDSIAARLHLHVAGAH